MKESFFDPAPTVARIIVTPIIDVALVLVIVLLVTAPMIAVTDVDVTLPAAKTRSVESHERVNITLGLGGELAVDDSDIRPAQLPSMIATKIKEHGDGLMVVVRADEGVPYEAVERLLKTARRAGAKRLAIATRQRGEAGK